MAAEEKVARLRESQGQEVRRPAPQDEGIAFGCENRIAGEPRFRRREMGARALRQVLGVVHAKHLGDAGKRVGNLGDHTGRGTNRLCRHELRMIGADVANLANGIAHRAKQVLQSERSGLHG